MHLPSPISSLIYIYNHRNTLCNIVCCNASFGIADLARHNLLHSSTNLLFFCKRCWRLPALLLLVDLSGRLLVILVKQLVQTERRQCYFDYCISFIEPFNLVLLLRVLICDVLRQKMQLRSTFVRQVIQLTSEQPRCRDQHLSCSMTRKGNAVWISRHIATQIGVKRILETLFQSNPITRGMEDVEPFDAWQPLHECR